jgi:hypothetical protein
VPIADLPIADLPIADLPIADLPTSDRDHPHITHRSPNAQDFPRPSADAS